LALQWSVELLNAHVLAEMEALNEDLRARFVRISNLLIQFGPHQVREPYVRHLRGKLWEMRMKGKDGIGRAIYIRGLRTSPGRSACLREEDAEDTECGFGNR